jgi:hypothetical protein
MLGKRKKEIVSTKRLIHCEKSFIVQNKTKAQRERKETIFSYPGICWLAFFQ